MVPSSLDQKPSGVGVPGFGDAALGAVLSGGVFAGDKAEVGANRAASEAVPVSYLHGQAKRRER